MALHKNIRTYTQHKITPISYRYINCVTDRLDNIRNRAHHTGCKYKIISYLVLSIRIFYGCINMRNTLTLFVEVMLGLYLQIM